MRFYWIQEVRYYKYIFLLCTFIICCSYLSLYTYLKQEENNGIIINVKFIHNVSDIIPIYKVRINNTTYIAHDECIIENIKNCNKNNFMLNTIVNLKRFNKMYIVTSPNYYILYFSIGMLSFAFTLMLFFAYAYFDFKRLQNREYNLWSKQKKSDIEINYQNENYSYIFF